MEKQVIIVKDKDGILKEAEVVLHCKQDNKEFIIYTFKEELSNKQTLIYASRIVTNNNKVVFEEIENKDWEKLKKLISINMKEDEGE